MKIKFYKLNRNTPPDKRWEELPIKGKFPIDSQIHVNDRITFAGLTYKVIIRNFNFEIDTLEIGVEPCESIKHFGIL